MNNESNASSLKQTLLEGYIEIIKTKVSEQAIQNNYINELNFDLPTLIIKKEFWHDVAQLIRDHEKFSFDYLMNLSGVDYEEYMEVIYHLYSFDRNEYLAVKVATERDGGSVPTVIDIWIGADWQEREVYDLLGIGFSGRKISRILLTDEWVGHPLRKDYVLIDEEV